jgi:exodeoxyribonuclease V alpha subunit
MSQLSDYEAKTIHRLLEVDHRNFGDMLCFHKNEKDPVDADVVLVDECSMVDVLLMDALLKGIKKDANIILVGDYYQLPSVGAGNVLKDIIASDCVNMVELNEIFRQAAQSLIVVNAHSIKNGEYPQLNVIDNDFFFYRLMMKKSWWIML